VGGGVGVGKGVEVGNGVGIEFNSILPEANKLLYVVSPEQL
jgi:hypothetical protein